MLYMIIIGAVGSILLLVLGILDIRHTHKLYAQAIVNYNKCINMYKETNKKKKTI